MAWTPIIYLAIWVTVWTFIGATMGAMRVRHSAVARQRYGKFVLIAAGFYYILIPLLFAAVYGVSATQRQPDAITASIVCAAIISAPIFCAVLMMRASVYLDPDPRYCKACGYEMRGAPTLVCPECGTHQRTG